MISLRRFLFVWIPLRWMLKLPTSLFGCLLIQVKFLVNPIILIILVLWFSWIGVKSFGKVISTFFRSFLLLAIFSLKCLPIDEVFWHQSLNFPSGCLVCKRKKETFGHLFISCLYAACQMGFYFHSVW